MKMSPSSMRYATLMEPAQFLIIKAEALTKSLGPRKSHEKSRRRWNFEMGGRVVMKHGHNMSQSWFICSWAFGIYGEVDQWIFSLSVGSHEFDIHDSFVSYHIIRCISNLILLYNLNRSNLAQLLRILWGRPGLLCSKNSWKFGVRDHWWKARINRVTGWALEKETEGGWCNKPPSNIISHRITHSMNLRTWKKDSYAKVRKLQSFGVWVYLPTRIWLQHAAAGKNDLQIARHFLYRSMLEILRTTFEILIRYFAFRLSAAIAEAWSIEIGAVDGDRELGNSTADSLGIH